MTITDLTTFLGWCTVLNMGLLLLAFVFLTLLKSLVLSIHSKLFGLPEEQLLLIYLRYLGHYKILVFVVNLVPYCALKIML